MRAGEKSLSVAILTSCDAFRFMAAATAISISTSQKRGYTCRKAGCWLSIHRQCMQSRFETRPIVSNRFAVIIRCEVSFQLY